MVNSTNPYCPHIFWRTLLFIGPQNLLQYMDTRRNISLQFFSLSKLMLINIWKTQSPKIETKCHFPAPSIYHLRPILQFKACKSVKMNREKFSFTSHMIEIFVSRQNPHKEFWALNFPLLYERGPGVNIGVKCFAK